MINPELNNALAILESFAGGEREQKEELQTTALKLLSDIRTGGFAKVVFAQKESTVYLRRSQQLYKVDLQTEVDHHFGEGIRVCLVVQDDDVDKETRAISMISYRFGERVTTASGLVDGMEDLITSMYSAGMVHRDLSRAETSKFLRELREADIEKEETQWWFNLWVNTPGAVVYWARNNSF